MDDFINDPIVPIIYYPYLREYNILLKRRSGGSQGICYCPWCGAKLSKDLRDEFYNIFFDELNLTPQKGLGILETPGLPEEFKTDEWWKKRGL
jgi:hypothetical protein